MTDSHYHLKTHLIHAGEAIPRIKDAVVMPIFQSAMYETAGETDYHNVRYIRLNNTLPIHPITSAHANCLKVVGECLALN